MIKHETLALPARAMMHLVCMHVFFFLSPKSPLNQRYRHEARAIDVSRRALVCVCVCMCVCVRA